MSADDQYLDEYDKYNVEQDKYEKHGHSGKGRTKKEAEQHHHEDASGHTRKAVQKLVNNAHKENKSDKTPVTSSKNSKTDKDKRNCKNYCILFGF